MDYSKLPKPTLGLLIIAVVLGIIVAIIVYQAQIRGLIPTFITSPKSPNLELRTVVQEENTVISVIEKAGLSVVVIGLEGEKNGNKGSGIGFIVDSKGLIVTNSSTVSRSGQYIIATKDGQKYEAKKIYNDPILDLSLIKIDAVGLSVLELGDSSKLKLGQTIITIGSISSQNNNIVSVGVVSGLSQKDSVNLIQTDAVVSANNLGGPMLSSAGQAIGINVAGAGASQVFGTAIPSNTIKQFISETIAKNSAEKPYLGLRYTFVSKDQTVAETTLQGAVIQEVIANGPADAAGIKVGDVITKINGQVIDSENKVADIVSKSKIGQQLELTILRSGKEMKITVSVMQLPNQ